MKNQYKFLVGMSDGNRPHARLRHRWKNNDEMDHGEISIEVCELDPRRSRY
jgi:hypothetical protein